jgi:hypothetical protein
MIYVCTQGGIGNQLFQIAYAIKLAKIFGQEIKLVGNHLNPRGGDRRLRGVEYLGFNFAKKEIFLPKFKVVRSPYVKYLCHGLNYVDDFTPASHIRSGRDLFLDGYFQRPGEIEAVRSDILKVLQAKLAELEIAPKSSNHVAIHIRRGDYVANEAASKTHGFLGLKYYLDAIQIMKENVEQPVFDIYTDDSAWVRANIFPVISANIVSERIANANLEFLSMLRYQNFIIANSTFSWWAPWLNGCDGNPLVVCPQNWYGNGDLSDLNNLESWIRI